MKKLLLITLCVLLVFSFVACSDGTSDGELPIQDSDLGDEEAIFEALFNKNNHISIRLDIDDAEMLKLQKDYESYSAWGSKSPIYRMAELYVAITDIDGNTREYIVEQVGIRMKGNTSRNDFYSEDEGMYNLVHFKLDFGETFDDEKYYGDDVVVWDSKEIRKERKNRTFATLEKLDLKWNRNFDTTYIKEGYAYDFYRESGIIVPHTNLASVDINDDHAGVWSIYEPIDDVFLEKNLPEEALGGDLYKLGWTSDGATFTAFTAYGVENEDEGQFFVYDLKTNKKKSNHSSLKSLIEILNSPNLTKAEFDSVVDTKSFVTYAAASYIVGNPDDLRNNYNNTYVYFRKDNDKMLVIPYDLDRVFGVNTWNPYGNGNVSDSPFQTDNVCGEQKNPLFTKTILNDGFLKAEFANELNRIRSSAMLSPQNFKAAYDVAANNYSGEVEPSKDYGNASRSSFYFSILETCEPSESRNMSFIDYITAKLATLSLYVANDGSVVDSHIVYVRGDFNNWAIEANYLMTRVEEGVYSFELSGDTDMTLKLYVNGTDEWYGAEFVDKDCRVEYESESDNKNLKLKKGSYTIYFYTGTSTINVIAK